MVLPLLTRRTVIGGFGALALGGLVGCSRDPVASGGAAQSACTSATRAVARSTDVGWSAIRISSVPSRGCGRASHQIRV